MTTTDPAARGYMLLSCINCLEAVYDEKTRTRVYDSLSPDVRALLGRIDKVEWYPVRYVSEFLREIALLDDDERKAHDRLVEVGRFIGATATNTFLRLIMKMMTPSLYAKKVRDFWARDHRVGKLEGDPSRIDDGIIYATLSGVGGYDYIGPVATGFMTSALELMRMKGVKGQIFGWSMANPGPAEMRYELSWKR